ncbi:glycosyl hydrolase [Cohnella sp. GCM10027633]|uniref:glycosyl hydrolase n=1 Tax=unclassified Cohnella TaxID=2636738 RepID=UPI0036388C24
MGSRLELEQAFREPPASHRPPAFWVWNDDMNEALIREQLEQLKSHGFGGAFVHPRPGLVTEYLGDEWFALWRFALEEAERIGMPLYIYDENSYPSGFAGGHVPAELPDCLANAVIMKELSLSELAASLPAASGTLNRPGHPIRAFAITRDGGGVGGVGGATTVVRDVTDLPFAEWSAYSDRFLLYEIGFPETNSWLGGFAYTDLLRPEVAELFLKTTYDAYRERFGDKFGDRIPAIFTDEPEISPGNLFQMAGANFLPFSYWFGGEFQARNGYDVKDYFPCLFVDVTEGSFDRDPRKVRYDFYDTVRELWTNNFLRPISAWCDKHGIAWTGHYLEHNWPYPWGRTSPSVMSLYEYMQWPAIDILRSNMLRQPGFEGTEMLTLAVREAHSAANQFGRERVLCEAYGAGGWDSDFRDYKRMGDWLFAHGINCLTPHLTLGTIVGARKRDHPQSFDWRQPWWDEYARLNGYFGRLSATLSQGKTNNAVLLLNPSTSGYLETPSSQSGELRTNDPPKHPDMGRYLHTALALCDGLVNYDLGDEFIMERHGDVEGRLMVVGEGRYDVVIYPDRMDTMKASTLRLLERFLQAGGTVLAMGEPSVRVDGEKSLAGAALTDYAGWERIADAETLIGRVRELVPSRLAWRDGAAVPRGVHYLRRDLPEGGAMVFVANSAPSPVREKLLVRGSRLELWDPWTGSARETACRVNGEWLELDVDLSEEGSLLLRVYEDGEAAVESVPAVVITDSVRRQLPLTGPTVATAEQDNMLVIDYCDVSVGGKRYEGIHVLQAQHKIYEAHGFDNNPWDNAIQFKRRLVDRNRFAAGSGFEATFRFAVDADAAPERLVLWVERGDLYRLEVNGQQAEWSAGLRSSLDHHLVGADIAKFAVPGDNEVTLRAQPFDLFMELEEVRLEGSFSVNARAGRWTIGREQPLAIGSWLAQGRPFYGGGATFEARVRIEDVAAGGYAVRLPSWAGTVASLHVNGAYVGLFGAGQGDELDFTRFAIAGDNGIRVRLSGSFRNVLGPFHDPLRTRKTAWPSNWKKGPAFGPPPAEAYDLLDYGLFGEIEVIARNRE